MAGAYTYTNDFATTDALPAEWSDQEVTLPLREVVRLYVHEATVNAGVDAEVTRLRAERDELRKKWLDEFSKHENAEAECKRLRADIEAMFSASEGGE
jgi:hypothetical protein